MYYSDFVPGGVFSSGSEKVCKVLLKRFPDILPACLLEW